MPEPQSFTDLPTGAPPPVDLEEAALRYEENLTLGISEMFAPIPVGFPQLDDLLGGGLHNDDLMVLGGPQNVGKTAAALQIAAHCARSALVVFVCYEHSTMVLLQRLLIQQSLNGQGQHTTTDEIRRASMDVIAEREALIADGGDVRTFEHFNGVLGKVTNGLQAWAKTTDVMRSLWLVRGDPLYVDLEALDAYVEMATKYAEHRRIVLFVDYIQRVPVINQHRALEPEERIEIVVKGLKGLSLKYAEQGFVLPVVGVGAADSEGLRKGRVHFESLWGSSIVQYEPDIAVILNKDLQEDDGGVVVRWALEKNRHGPSDIEFLFPYYGAAYSFAPEGQQLAYSESWQVERRELVEKAKGDKDYQ